MPKHGRYQGRVLAILGEFLGWTFGLDAELGTRRDTERATGRATVRGELAIKAILSEHMEYVTAEPTGADKCAYGWK